MAKSKTTTAQTQTIKKPSAAKKKTTVAKSSGDTALRAKAGAKKLSPQEAELLNETGRRKVNVAPKTERRKRRRQIDPTTCEREYSDPEIQFMHAMDEYKRDSGRMFPTCSEMLEVLHRLGYRQVEEAHELMYEPNKPAVSEEGQWSSDEGEDDEN